MTEEKKELTNFARAIRRNIVTMIASAGSGHPGGSLSAVDIMTVLMKRYMKFDAANPNWEKRDRFILSKGHAAPVLYAILAKLGYFPKDTLKTFRKLHSILQGHPDCTKTSGVEISTGSLGQGLSIAGGIALGAKIKNLDFHTYVLLGDGEIQEGQVWEAAMAIAHHKLNNLTAIVDNNNLQIDGSIPEVMNIYPITDKFTAFGWDALEINGHDFKSIENAFEFALSNTSRPTAIIAKTIKGKGVSFMENQVAYHHTKDLSDEMLKKALRELEAIR